MRGVYRQATRAYRKGRFNKVVPRKWAETTLEALEASLRTAELVLGHTLKGVRRTYDHHSYMEEKKAALEVLASLLATIVE
jgi:integrase